MNFFITLKQLFILKRSILVGIKSVEDLLELSDLLFCDHILDHHCHSCLLELLSGVELEKLRHCFFHHGIVSLGAILLVIFEPFVLEALLRRDSLFGIIAEHLFHQINGVI